MPKKEDIIHDIKQSNQQNFKRNAVVELINSVNLETRGKFKIPSSLLKGDVFLYMYGKKTRPCVIVSVSEDTVSALPLSTTKDCLNLCSGNSRFFGKSYFGNSFVTVKYEDAVSNLIGVYGNNRAINKAIRAIKEKILEL